MPGCLPPLSLENPQVLLTSSSESVILVGSTEASVVRSFREGTSVLSVEFCTGSLADLPPMGLAAPFVPRVSL